MTHRRYERVFMRLCGRFQLNPSRWLPHFKPTGIYEMGTRYDSSSDMFDEEGNLKKGTEVPIEVFSIYSLFESICRERARERLGLNDRDWVRAKLGFWYEFWGFLAEVDMGVFDTTAWVQDGTVELPDGSEVEFLYHSDKGDE